MLLKGTLRRADPASWTADVQVAGSLGSYLLGLPLSSAIPPWELVAGRTVLVAVPDAPGGPASGGNPGDAYVLAVLGAYSGPPRCRVYHSANQTLTSGVLLYLSFDRERFDTDGMHDPATNNSRITIRTAGVYAGMASVEFAANSTGVRLVRARRNGAGQLAEAAVPASPAASYPTVVSLLLPPYRYGVGDYVEIGAYQDSGANFVVYSSPTYSPEFGLWMVGT